MPALHAGRCAAIPLGSTDGARPLYRRPEKVQRFQCSSLIPVSIAQAADLRNLGNRRTELSFRNKALKTRTRSVQSTASERMGLRERICGEMPERQSKAFDAKARRTWGFQAREKRRETVANKRMAEGVGFEPTVPAKVHRFSRPAQSTTLSPLRGNRPCFGRQFGRDRL